MARKSLLVRRESLETLRQLLRKKSNLDCSNSSDMQKMQVEIKKATGFYLSIQTLNRFFGLVQSGFNPSLDTLNILSQFLKYKSFQEFEKINTATAVEGDQKAETPLSAS